MFDKQKTTEAPAAVQPTAAPSVADVIVHAMPREFYGKEAEVVGGGQTTSLPPAPVPLKPVIVQPRPIVLAAGPGVPVKAKRSMKGMVIMAIVCLAVLGTGAFAAYKIVESVKEQKHLAEVELQKLQAEQEADAAEAARRAEQEAIAAATPTPAKDTDSDGLTDIEELLYGTNFREPDSDKDSFLDGNEVFHRYHPLGLAPSTLLDTGAVKIFENAEYPFTIYYPSTWSTAFDEGVTAVTFRSSRQATIRAEWEEKDATETLADWYDAELSGNDAKNLKEILTKAGYYGLTTSDDRTSYLDLGTGVITLTYDLGDRTQIEYLQTFQMMVNSVEVIGVLGGEEGGGEVEDETAS